MQNFSEAYFNHDDEVLVGGIKFSTLSNAMSHSNCG